MTREEAIDTLLNTSFFGRSMDDIDGAIDMAVEALKAEPVKHGHWIKDWTGAENCSVCGEYPFDDGEYHIANWNSKYCPHCGAKMDEKETDNE